MSNRHVIQHRQGLIIEKLAHVYKNNQIAYPVFKKLKKKELKKEFKKTPVLFSIATNWQHARRVMLRGRAQMCMADL